MKTRDSRQYINLRIDPDLLERIDEEAKARVVSRTWLITQAIEAWMEVHEGAA